MRPFDEIAKSDRVYLDSEGIGEDGMRGEIIHPGISNKHRRLVFVASNGGGWEHVSVSTRNHCPTWNDMCIVKDLFFYPEEVCVQFHPAESDYVNNVENCLHIWRPINQGIPTPPAIFVGFKDLGVLPL